jgi:hypothetical protein
MRARKDKQRYIAEGLSRLAMKAIRLNYVSACYTDVLMQIHRPLRAVQRLGTRMSPKFASKIDEMDPKRVTVRLSQGVRKALSDLAATVHFSSHFDQGMLQTVNDLAGGKAMSADDVMGSLPLIAEHTFNHIHAEGDERARKAWQALSHAFLEEGFTLIKGRGRGS